MPAGHLPFFLRVLGPRLPPEATEAFLAKNFYDIARARWNAFERGAELARRIDA